MRRILPLVDIHILSIQRLAGRWKRNFHAETHRSDAGFADLTRALPNIGRAGIIHSTRDVAWAAPGTRDRATDTLVSSGGIDLATVLSPTVG